MALNHNKDSTTKVVLVTGGARRIGAATVRYFHSRGYRVLIHYHQSQEAAQDLMNELLTIRPDSCLIWECDLADTHHFSNLSLLLESTWYRLDAIVHNASTFLRRPFETALLTDWNTVFDSNVKGAYFLTQALLPWLKQSQGCLVNITDIHAQKPMRDYSLYCMAKAALSMMTQSLAKELAPSIRVNAIAPGAILPPEGDNALSPEWVQRLFDRIPLKRFGSPEDIASMVWILVEQCPYITGQIFSVDGGRSLS